MCGLSIATYALEMAAPRKKKPNRLQITQRAMEWNRIQNDDIKRAPNVTDIIRRAMKQIQQWAGHVIPLNVNVYLSYCSEDLAKQKDQLEGKRRDGCMTSRQVNGASIWQGMEYINLKEVYIQQWIVTG